MHPGTLAPGALFQMMGPGPKRYFFLGPCLDKPRTQVFIEAFLSGQPSDTTAEACILQPESEKVEIYTSQQVFRKVLEECKLVDSITFQVFDYSIPLNRSALSVTFDPREGRRFTVTTQKRVQIRNVVVLPFGMKKRRKPRGPRASKKSRTSGGAASGVDASTGPPDAGEVPVHSQSSSDTSEPEDVQGDILSHASEAEDEKPFQTGQQVADEKAVKAVIKEHFEDIEKLNAARAAKVEDADKATGGQTVKGTFCQAILGICGVSIQKAARLARCRHCLIPISKQSVRFSYSYNMKKFHAYLHTDCVVEHLLQEGANLDQAVSYLTEWKASTANAASGSGDSDGVVTAKAVEVVLERLLNAQQEARPS